MDELLEKLFVLWQQDDVWLRDFTLGSFWVSMATGYLTGVPDNTSRIICKHFIEQSGVEIDPDKALEDAATSRRMVRVLQCLIAYAIACEGKEDDV